MIKALLKKLIVVTFSFLIIDVCKSQNIYTISGGYPGYSGDGGPANMALISPQMVTTDVYGNIYISDYGNHRIRKINSSGIITTIAGTGIFGFSGDGGLATSAQIKEPTGISVDANGNIYFSDKGNLRIRKINTSGIISTVAGTGIFGFSGDGGQAILAKITHPNGLAVDVGGNIYFSDTDNSLIRKINASGIITTIAGTPGSSGFSGDGGLATNAKLNLPFGLAIAGGGNIYISDRSNNCIRKINNSNIITTVAGIGGNWGAFSGDGGAATSAEFDNPYGVSVDAAGNVFVTDFSNNRIRKINTAGIINTIAGIGAAGNSGDGGLASLAKLNRPLGIAVDMLNNIYFVDEFNYSLRIICNGNCLAGIISHEKKKSIFKIFPNPNNGLFQFQIDNEIENGELILINSLGQTIYNCKIIQGINEINTNGLSLGLYNYIVLSKKQQIDNGKISIE